MEPDGFVLQPARGEGMAAADFRRSRGQVSIDLVHLKLAVIERTFFHSPVEAFCLFSILRKLHGMDGAFQEVRHVTDSKCLWLNPLRTFRIVRHLIKIICGIYAVFCFFLRSLARFENGKDSLQKLSHFTGIHRFFFTGNAGVDFCPIGLLDVIHALIAGELLCSCFPALTGKQSLPIEGRRYPLHEFRKFPRNRNRLHPVQGVKRVADEADEL